MTSYMSQPPCKTGQSFCSHQMVPRLLSGERWKTVTSRYHKIPAQGWRCKGYISTTKPAVVELEGHQSTHCSRAEGVRARATVTSHFPGQHQKPGGQEVSTHLCGTKSFLGSSPAGSPGVLYRRKERPATGRAREHWPSRLM